MTSTNPFDTRYEEEVPSYEESVASPPSLTNTSEISKRPLPQSSPALPLPLQLSNTRTSRIESILSTYVDPLLLSQGSSGIYKTTFILIPSSVSSLQDAVSNAYTTPQEPQVVGFPSDEVVKVVRLKGEENAMEFWRQRAVVAELESSMKARLVASGHRLHETLLAADGTTMSQTITTEEELAAPAPAAPVKAKPKMSLWGRAKAKYMLPPTDDEIEDRGLGWRAANQHPPAQDAPGKVPTGLVKVSILWKEVCLRIANEMGLYESKRGPGLCLSVEVGT
ncbi:hypothetical protein AJ80_02303 [Polytolypa hystricis UAMH7299]|uniref:Uncharacterized protein n=1 Tax=Polytolypa hystricis (strain UAMH7299) TaxID=1447883 RepID=A0A2B7YSU9_POLH7|nr:hypothetical protein AJ80_02303 [Polytolypa hystricis UAMH7299]